MGKFEIIDVWGKNHWSQNFWSFGLVFGFKIKNVCFLVLIFGLETEKPKPNVCYFLGACIQ